MAWTELCVGRPALGKCRIDLIALVREALTTERSDAVQVEPYDARLVICGDRLWLQMLVAEIIALNGTRVAVRFEIGADRSALRFAWCGFCATRTDALQIVLIEAIARVQGADVVMNPDGLSLLWPLQQVELT